MDNFNPKEMSDKIVDALKNEYKKLTKLNVMVLGKTGVGKSTLINNMFNEKMTETGVGKPITKQIRKIEKEDFPLVIYDTPGLELTGENSINDLLKDIKKEIDTGANTKDINNMIHCIWYCVATPSNRFEQSEIDFLKDFISETSKYKIPVILVLTKSYSKDDAENLKKEIEKEKLDLIDIVYLLAEDYIIDKNYTIESYGLEELAELMYNAIPEEVKKTFVTVQKTNLELKKNRAHKIVSSAAVTAAAVGAAPIPFSDATILVPQQIAMIAGITAAFGLSVERTTMTAIITATLGTSLTTSLGRSIVANAAKFIPGAGSIIGGAISGGTAAALTAALGEAYIAIMVKVTKGELEMKDLKSKEGKKIMTDIFKKELKKKKDENKEDK